MIIKLRMVCNKWYVHITTLDHKIVRTHGPFSYAEALDAVDTAKLLGYTAE